MTTDKKISSFPPGVAQELGAYVCRLIDPRNGQTFYVGKGHNNRVFQHAAGVSPDQWKMSAAEKKSDDLDLASAKIQTIRAIKNEGMAVIAVIHRHGLTDREALEVEAALIDAYPGLANIQNGHGSADRGCMSVEQILREAEASEAYFGDRKLLLIKIRSSVIVYKGGVYEAVRASWRINDTRAAGRPVLAVENGIIRGVFTAEWHASTEENRKEFDGGEIHEPWAEALIGKRIQPQYKKKGEACPIRYVN